MPVSLASTQTMETTSKLDIWRDTNEPILRFEWKTLAKHLRSVREEMDGWNPRSRDSAKRMKQNIAQIRIDVSRTWANHSAFRTDNGRQALERVLVSWVAHCPRVGYCQSFNFVAAMILAVCKGNQDETLSIFACLLEDTSFGDYFHREKNFEALHEDTGRMGLLLLEEDQVLFDHLASTGFELVTVTPTWFLTSYFLQLGPDQAVLVLDQVLRAGRDARSVLIKHGVAFLLGHRTDLLRCPDMETVLLFLKRQNPRSHDHHLRQDHQACGLSHDHQHHPQDPQACGLSCATHDSSARLDKHNYHPYA